MKTNLEEKLFCVYIYLNELMCCILKAQDSSFLKANDEVSVGLLTTLSPKSQVCRMEQHFQCMVYPSHLRTN